MLNIGQLVVSREACCGLQLNDITRRFIGRPGNISSCRLAFPGGRASSRRRQRTRRDLFIAGDGRCAARLRCWTELGSRRHWNHAAGQCMLQSRQTKRRRRRITNESVQQLTSTVLSLSDENALNCANGEYSASVRLFQHINNNNNSNLTSYVHSAHCTSIKICTKIVICQPLCLRIGLLTCPLG